MHRIDTPTAQKDKWGSGKNGFTDGDPATGVKATSLNAALFDSVQEEICNVIEKNGITLDKSKNDQLFAAIQAMIDTSESELNLGTAAYRNVADDAPGDLVPVGYKGNFKSECNHDGIDFASYPFVVGESLFIDVRLSTNTPPFLNQDYYFISVICATNPAQGGRVNRPLIQFVSYTNSTMILAIREDDGTTIGWRYFRAVQYDSDNTTLTTPGRVRAFNGGVELDENAVVIRAAGNKHLYFFNTENEEMGLVYAGDDAVLHLRGGGGPSLSIEPDGSITAPGYFGAGDDIHSGRNISSDGLIQAGAGVYDTPGVRTYSPNNPPPPPPLTDVALGAEGSFIVQSNGWQRVPVGCAQTGYNFEGDNPGGDTIFYRPIQKYVTNVGWVTVGHTA